MRVKRKPKQAGGNAGCGRAQVGGGGSSDGEENRGREAEAEPVQEPEPELLPQEQPVVAVAPESAAGGGSAGGAGAAAGGGAAGAADGGSTGPAEPVKPLEKPKPPEIIVLPAGPMLDKPRPAKLSGPQVVRVEAPEPLDRPQVPLQAALRRSRDSASDLCGQRRRRVARSSAVADKKGAKPPPQQHKDRTHGRRKEETDEDAVKKAKQHKSWRQRDIEERQARLTAAGGEGLRLRPTRRIASKAQREAATPGAAEENRPSANRSSSRICPSALAVKATDIIGKLDEAGHHGDRQSGDQQ